jgi:lysocardiolipin and lysophospholipid acyltransferase
MCSDCILLLVLDGQLDAVYDFTIAYPKTVPQTELDLLKGKFPEEIHFNIKR